MNGVSGPVKDIVIEPEYLDVSIPPGVEYTHETRRGHTVFAYIFDGSGTFGFGENGARRMDNHTLVLFDDGDSVTAKAGDMPFRFLLISGKPLNEPVAWRGPIVMNTQEELATAFREYSEGTFIKHKALF